MQNHFGEVIHQRVRRCGRVGIGVVLLSLCPDNFPTSWSLPELQSYTRTRIGGFPNAAADCAEVESFAIARDARYGNGASSAKWSDQPPAPAREKFGRHLLREAPTRTEVECAQSEQKDANGFRFQPRSMCASQLVHSIQEPKGITGAVNTLCAPFRHSSIPVTEPAYTLGRAKRAPAARP